MALTKEQINQRITEIYTQFLDKINSEGQIILSTRELVAMGSPNMPHYQLWLRQVFRNTLQGLSEEDRNTLVKAIERRLHPDKLKMKAAKIEIDSERDFAGFFVVNNALDFPFSELQIQAKTRGHDAPPELPTEDPDLFKKNRLYQLSLRLKDIFEESSRYSSSIRFLTKSLYYFIYTVAIISYLIANIVLLPVLFLSEMLKGLAEAALALLLPKFRSYKTDFLQEQRSSAIDFVHDAGQLNIFFSMAIVGIELPEDMLRGYFGSVAQYMRNNPMNGEKEINFRSTLYPTYLKVGYQAIYAAAVQKLPDDENIILSVLKRIAKVTISLALQTFIVVPSTLVTIADDLLSRRAILPLILASKTLAFGLLNTPLYMLDGARYLKNALVSLVTSKPAASNENQLIVAVIQNQPTRTQDPDNTRGAASMRFFDGNSGRSTPDIQGQQSSAEPAADDELRFN